VVRSGVNSCGIMWSWSEDIGESRAEQRAEHCNDRGYRGFHANGGLRDTASGGERALPTLAGQGLFYEQTLAAPDPDADRDRQVDRPSRVRGAGRGAKWCQLVRDMWSWCEHNEGKVAGGGQMRRCRSSS